MLLQSLASLDPSTRLLMMWEVPSINMILTEMATSQGNTFYSFSIFFILIFIYFESTFYRIFFYCTGLSFRLVWAVMASFQLKKLGSSLILLTLMEMVRQLGSSPIGLIIDLAEIDRNGNKFRSTHTQIINTKKKKVQRTAWV